MWWSDAVKPSRRDKRDKDQVMRDVPGTDDWVWADAEVERLKAAFERRDCGGLPRTEALFSVAAEGIRIYVERQSQPSNVTRIRRTE
jgi:hypothetical protein